MEELMHKIDELDRKLSETKQSVDKMRKYFLWTLILSLGFFVIPLLGALFMLPKMMSIMTSGLTQTGL